MKIFAVNNDTLKAIPHKDFKLEKDIQNLVEKNLEVLFNLHFVTSEFQIRDFRIDTLAFNKESKSFVIIEYKKERNSLFQSPFNGFLSMNGGGFEYRNLRIGLRNQ
mgnify:CR=1 FL=1